MNRNPLIRNTRLLLAMAVVVLTAASAGAQSFVYLPTGDETDARFLNLSSTALIAFGSANLGITIGIPGSRTSFELGVFDGDNGKDSTGAISPAGGNWDLGSAEMQYCLYADPVTPSIVDPAELIGCWHANQDPPIPGPLWSAASPSASSPTMVNNDWWSLSLSTGPEAQTPSGDYFYFLAIEQMGSPGLNSSNFKIRSEGQLRITPSSWSIESSLRQPFNDGPVVYPSWDGVTVPGAGDDFWLVTPTTYDGTYSFQLVVPGGLETLTVWDGDGDLGTGSLTGIPSGQTVSACDDTDDPDTPNGFLPFWSTAGTQLEGDKGAGSPTENTVVDLFRREDCLAFRLVDPDGNVYNNTNPSGNQEWENFTVTTDPGVDADVYVGGSELPAGLWRFEIVGLDLNNFLALRSMVDFCVGDCELVHAGTGTPGYWKNHPGAWPVAEIVAGGVTYTVVEAIAAMNAKGGDMSVVLFQHYVAAFLNVASGAEDFCILETLASADAWLADHPPGSGVRGNSAAWDEGEPLKTRLDQYNNGQLCAPSRDVL